MLDTITHRLDSVTQRLDSVSNELSSLIHEVHQTLPTAVNSIPASDSFVQTTYIPTIVRLGLDKWDILAFIIALVSLYYACKAYRSQKETERNTMKITKESQFMLMIDYFRHFYANLIASKSIVAKLDNRFHTHYPSEEHIRKLGVDTDALHPEVFFHSKEKYHHIHELLMLVNNYNTELGVAEKHLCTQNLIAEAKLRDLNTLIFKQDLFCEKFRKAMEELCKPDEPTGWIKRKRCICLYEEAGRLEDIENAQKRYNEYIEKSRNNIIDKALSRIDLSEEDNQEAIKKAFTIKSPSNSNKDKRFIEKYTDQVDKILCNHVNTKLRTTSKNTDIPEVKTFSCKGANFFSADEKQANNFAKIFFHDDKDRELFFMLINSNIFYEIHGKNTQGYDKIAILPF
ncbi:MAG: hypothetical protein K2I28_00780 [Muribaculaceae bacterium]|nr:hypothetical protein [Muribaculaceae bacterium]